MITSLAKTLILCGVLFVIVGGALLLSSRLGYGRWPDDFTWQTFSVPLLTCLVLSLALTVVVNLILRFFR